MADDFDRDVYCMAGLPFDAADMARTLDVVREAARVRRRCFLSTANLNYLMTARRDADFRASIVRSDFVVVDGMPLIWLARWLGLPLPERVAGSTLFEALRQDGRRPPLTVYLFGGPDGVAERAAASINAAQGGVRCVGFRSPGFGDVASMSGDETIKAINASGADFLVVAISARKGQEWIMRNMERLQVPLVSHLGAVVNFEAETVRRAPRWMQRSGLEWLWRIREEPALWRRYWHDGSGFLRLLLWELLPLGLYLRCGRRAAREKPAGRMLLQQDGMVCRASLSGRLADPVGPEMRQGLRECAAAGTADVVLDLSQVRFIGAAMAGQLLMLEKQLLARGGALRMVGAQGNIRRVLCWHGLARWLAD